LQAKAPEIRREAAPPAGGCSVVELNTKARYAVMAMADLAKCGGAERGGQGTAVPLSAIAERQNLSLAYLEQIFLRLRRAGLVESARGRAGGYVLARRAQDIVIAEIMNAVHEETRMTRCLDAEIGCVGDQRCLTHDLWHALGGHIATFLASVSLQEVLDGIPADKLAVQPREKELAVG
jgi:Rrf2 family transcriptional regulator, iron-sulfur cluster assembly transcription factor